MTCVLVRPDISLTITQAVTGHTRISKLSTDYCPNCTQKCVINYTNESTGMQNPCHPIIAISLQAARIGVGGGGTYSPEGNHVCFCNSYI